MDKDDTHTHTHTHTYTHKWNKMQPEKEMKSCICSNTDGPRNYGSKTKTNIILNHLHVEFL